MGGFAGDVTLAVRRLLTTSLFAIFAVLSVAVGVGVTSAIYSVGQRHLSEGPWHR